MRMVYAEALNTGRQWHEVLTSWHPGTIPPLALNHAGPVAPVDAQFPEKEMLAQMLAVAMSAVTQRWQLAQRHHSPAPLLGSAQRQHTGVV